MKPPYLKNNKINRKTIDKIKFIGGYKGSWNLYYYFIKESITLLKNEWFLIFIVPISFLTNTYAKELRSFLYDNWKILEIYSFEEKKIFENADIETVIVVYQKDLELVNNKQRNMTIWMIRDSFNVKNWIKLSDFNIKNVPWFNKQNKKWSIHASFLDEKVINKNKRNNKTKTITVKDVFNISVGMVSWNDKSFDITWKKTLFSGLNKLEKKYIINIVKTDILYKDKFIPHPFIFIPKWTYVDESKLRLDCPELYNYLIQYKYQLEKRYWSKKIKWWEWATVRNKEIFENNKEYFFIPSITRKDVGFNYIYSDEILYWWWNVLTLTFKDNIDEQNKIKYKKIITSLNFKIKINKLVPKKGWRKMFSYSFLADIPL